MVELESKYELISNGVNDLMGLFTAKVEKMKKVLVIHPTDKSTDFLSNIYKNKEGWDVLRKFDGTKTDLINKMEGYDLIIMMGHGSPSGLFDVSRFYKKGKNNGYMVIDYEFADVLSRKECISIWCNSDKFFKKYGIKGFHTGMVISEVGEASYVLGYTPLNKKETLDNMNFYATLLGECIEKSPNEIRDYMLENYNREDAVSEYNRSTLIVL